MLLFRDRLRLCVFLAICVLLSLATSVSESQELSGVKRLRDVFTSYFNSEFSGKVLLNGKVIQEFEYEVGGSGQDYSKVVAFRGDSAGKIEVVAEEIARGGIWVRAMDRLAGGRGPSFFTAGFVGDEKHHVKEGNHLGLGVLAIGDAVAVDLSSEEVCNSVAIESSLPFCLVYRSDDVDVRFLFDELWSQFHAINIQIHCEVKKFSGEYDDHGNAVLSPEFLEREFELREFRINEENQITEMQLYYRNNGIWSPTMRVEVDSISPRKQPFPDRIEFKATRTPKSRNVFIDDDVGEYQIVDGGLFRLFDMSAQREISRIRGSDFALPLPDRGIGWRFHDYLRMSASRHCGLYSGAVCVETLGREVDAAKMFRPTYISSDSGSSAADMIKFFSDYGLNAKTYSGGSRELLHRISENGDVALLHFGNSNESRQMQHWVAFVGMQGEKARIVDLPRRESLYSISELLTEWDGIAVVASKGSITGYSAVSFFSQLWPFVLITVFGLLTLRWGISVFRKSSKFIESVVILLISVLVAGFWNCFTESGFRRNPRAVQLVIGRNAVSEAVLTDQLAEVEIPGAIFVDARIPTDYQQGHITGAVNLPVDFSIGELDHAENAFGSKDAKLVIYCSSVHCKWAESLAARLEALGYENTSVYSPGYAGYLSALEEAKSDGGMQ